MEYFYGGGGSSNPDFTYRFLVKQVTEEMYDWCGDYPLNGPFERWHIKHQSSNANGPIIQMESRKAAYMFRLTFSEHIIQDMTYNFAKDDKWTT